MFSRYLCNKFNAGRSRMLFEGSYELSSTARMYDVSPDGSRFIMSTRSQDEPLRQINVVLNWFQELERIVSGEK